MMYAATVMTFMVWPPPIQAYHMVLSTERKMANVRSLTAVKQQDGNLIIVITPPFEQNLKAIVLGVRAACLPEAPACTFHYPNDVWLLDSCDENGSHLAVRCPEAELKQVVNKYRKTVTRKPYVEYSHTLCDDDASSKSKAVWLNRGGSNMVQSLKNSNAYAASTRTPAEPGKGWAAVHVNGGGGKHAAPLLKMPMALVAAYDSFEYAPLVSPQLLAVSTDGQLLLIPVCRSGVPPAAGVPPSQVICCLPTPTKWELHWLPDKYQLSPLQQQLPSLFAALSGCKPTAQRSGKKRKAADMDPSKGTEEGAGASAAAEKPTACAGAAEPAAAAGAAAEALAVNQPKGHVPVRNHMGMMPLADPAAGETAAVPVVTTRATGGPGAGLAPDPTTNRQGPGGTIGAGTHPAGIGAVFCSGQMVPSHQCKRLQDRVAIVTAATAGIGLGIAERLASEGARVMICSRRQDNVDDTVKALRAQGLEVSGVVCHVGNAQHRQALIDATLKAYGKIDILVSNAAVNPTAGPLLETSPDAIDKILDINIKAALLLVQAAAKHMRRGGRIVLISSVTAYQPPAPIAMYAVSKTALLGLTKGLAAELGPEGITVNCVAPGVVPTKFSAALVANPELEQAQIEATSVKRLGTPEDIAAAVAYLVSDDASYVNGETLVVSGGMGSRL